MYPLYLFFALISYIIQLYSHRLQHKVSQFCVKSDSPRPPTKVTLLLNGSNQMWCISQICKQVAIAIILSQSFL